MFIVVKKIVKNRWSQGRRRVGERRGKKVKKCKTQGRGVPTLKKFTSMKTLPIHACERKMVVKDELHVTKTCRFSSNVYAPYVRIMGPGKHNLLIPVQAVNDQCFFLRFLKIADFFSPEIRKFMDLIAEKTRNP